MSRPPCLAARAVRSATPRNPNLHAAARATAQPTTVITQYMRAQVRAAGGDPSTVPDVPYGFVRAAKVCAVLDISIATYYRMIADGTLPRPIPIDRASSRAAATGGPAAAQTAS